MKCILITGRTIKQGMALEAKNSTMYLDAVAICEFDPDDMKVLKITEGETALVKTDSGEVYVRAVKSLQSPHRGIIFIPMGPWANMVTNPDTNSTGMPSFKGVPAHVEPAKDKRVLPYDELLKMTYGK